MTQPATTVVLGTCGNCKFWQDLGNGVIGRCRFNAPQLASVQVGYRAIWPQCESTDWCGQWVSAT